MIEYFISSTFRDMQAERDALRNYVLPEIRKYANERGEDVGMLDLRWGIDTADEDSDENMAKVLSVCLQNIDQCHPHMIILLGDRYGSTPSEETLRRFVDRSSGGHYTQAQLRGKSVTEMEIIHGLFRYAKAPDDIVICIREPLPYDEMPPAMRAVYDSQTDAARESIRRLKESLRARYPDNVISYSASWNEASGRIDGLDAFIDPITARLKNQLDHFLPKRTLYAEEKLRNRQISFFAEVRRQFCGRDREIADILDFLEGRDSNLLVLRSDFGSGRSWLCAKIAELRQDDCLVIPVLIDQGGGNLSAEQLLKQIVWVAEEWSGTREHFTQSAHTYDEWRAEARRLLRSLSKKVLLILDDMDMLAADPHKIDADFLPFYDMDHVKIIVTARRGFKIPANLSVNFRLRTMALEDMDEAAARDIISSWLRAEHRELPDYVTESLVFSARYRSPYYLELLLYKLAHLSEADYARIQEQSAIDLDDNAKLYHYLRRSILDLPASEGEILRLFLEDALSLLPKQCAHEPLIFIAKTLRGFRMEDLYRLLRGEAPMVDLSRFLQMAECGLRCDDLGRIHFSNHLARRAAEAIWAKLDVDQSALDTELFEYLSALPDDDFIKVHEYLPACLRQNKARDAARYLSSAYQEDYRRMRGGAARSLSFEIAASLKSTLQYPEYEARSYCHFLNDMVRFAEGFSPADCCGFISAILFSHDLLFGAALTQQETQAFMARLHDAAIAVLYPNRGENRLYLRAVYVCCEQCGMRTTDFQVRRRMYREFYQYCAELMETIAEGDELWNDIIHDLSIAYEKNAMEYYRSDSAYAMELFDRAVATAKRLTPAAPDYDRFKGREFDLLLSRASSVIERELILKRNQSGFWDEDRLKSVAGDLERARKYYSENQNSFMNRHNLVLTCRELANVCYCFDAHDEERAYLLRMYSGAKALCAERDSVILMDFVRFSSMRLGICRSEEISERQRLAWLAEAAEHSKRLAFDAEKENQNAPEVLFFALDAYISAWQKYHRREEDAFAGEELLEQKSPDEIAGFAEAVRSVEACLADGTVKKAFEASVDEEKMEAFYHRLTAFFSLADQCRRYMHALALQAYQREDYLSAIQRGELCLSLWQLQKDARGAKNLIPIRLDICHLLYACCHDALHALDSEAALQVAGKERYYLQMIANDCMAIDALEPGNDVSPYYRRSVWEMKMPDHKCHAVAWIHLLCVAADRGNCDLFWDAVERAEFRINGQNCRKLYLEIAEFSPLHKDFPPLSRAELDRAGEYLCRNLGEERVLKLLYKSDLFECTALEYACRHDLPDAAAAILENGYDRYLELPFLFILRKYDRHEYQRRMKELKPVCHSHNIRIARKELAYRSFEEDDKALQKFYSEYVQEAKRLKQEAKR